MGMQLAVLSSGPAAMPGPRGSHSSASQLNLSGF